MRKITPEDEELVKWAMICHASGLLGLIIPYANMLGPYYILKKLKIRTGSCHIANFEGSGPI